MVPEPWETGAALSIPALEAGKPRPEQTGDWFEVTQGGAQEPRPELGLTHPETQWGWEDVAMAFVSGVNSGPWRLCLRMGLRLQFGRLLAFRII